MTRSVGSGVSYLVQISAFLLPNYVALGVLLYHSASVSLKIQVILPTSQECFEDKLRLYFPITFLE